MAKLTHLLDDLQLRHWIAQRNPVAKSDGEGLTFTLSSAGAATWILRYRHGRRRRELTIGSYPDISLKLARKKASEFRVQIAEGIDPAAFKQAEKAKAVAAWTVRQLHEDYQAKRLVPGLLASKTIDYRERDYEQVVLPRLGARLVSDIKPCDVVEMLERAKRSWTVSKRLLTSTAQLFQHACGRRLIDANPCTGIHLPSVIGRRPPVRRRVMLSKEELSSLLQNIDGFGLENALAFKILLATCVRTVELVKAKKEDINLNRATWYVPDTSVKTRQGFLVPLAPVVLDWMRQLWELSGESAYLLPARTESRLRRNGGDTHVGTTTLWAAIARTFERQAMDIRRFTPHDTRSTAKGHMRNLGISKEISEIALNHALKGMEAIYDVREEIPERRIALQRWAEFIVACEKGEPTPTNVLPFVRSEGGTPSPLAEGEVHDFGGTHNKL